MVARVLSTPKTDELVERLRSVHGALLFHQSGGGCDGSSPMCYPLNEFRVGPQDVLLGEISGCPFYMGAAQFEYLEAHATDYRRGTRAGRRVLAGGSGGYAVPDAQPAVYGRGGGGAGCGGAAGAGRFAVGLAA